MTTVCMDCQKVCGKSRPPGNSEEASPKTSHGLCVRCYATRMGAIETTELTTWVDSEVNRLPTGKIILDEQLCVIGYSKEEEKLTGLISAEILGKKFFADVAPLYYTMLY